MITKVVVFAAIGAAIFVSAPAFRSVAANAHGGAEPTMTPSPRKKPAVTTPTAIRKTGRTETVDKDESLRARGGSTSSTAISPGPTVNTAEAQDGSGLDNANRHKPKTNTTIRSAPAGRSIRRTPPKRKFKAEVPPDMEQPSTLKSRAKTQRPRDGGDNSSDHRTRKTRRAKIR